MVFHVIFGPQHHFPDGAFGKGHFRIGHQPAGFGTETDLPVGFPVAGGHVALLILQQHRQPKGPEFFFGSKAGVLAVVPEG